MPVYATGSASAVGRTKSVGHWVMPYCAARSAAESWISANAMRPVSWVERPL